MDATWSFKERLAQLFGLIVQKHDATTSIGKFSGCFGLIYPTNCKLSPKGCRTLAWPFFFFWQNHV